MIKQQLDEYNEELAKAEELSRQKIEALIESEKKEILYDWPGTDALLITLYEIVWLAGDASERGWSLSDRPDDCEYLNYTEQGIYNLNNAISTVDWEESCESLYAILPESVPLAPEGFADFGVMTEQASFIGYNPIAAIMVAIESKANKMNEDCGDDTAGW